MVTPPLTGSLSSPLVTAMADTPIRYMDGTAFDFFLIEMVNTLRASSAHAQARASKVEQEMIDAGLLPTPLPTPGMRKDHRDSATSLASKATTKVEDEEDGLKLRLEAIGMHVGANITERYPYSFH
jgi:trafficking protein particle complex subunit 6